ncbi:MAG: peptide chain release factor N(5)-glutamine methyltransferase [Rhodobacteraceae bacterium]|nr:peptide chain release factor N(5)-glutamine methyltransferase [Paracoccaceae bacterium]
MRADPGQGLLAGGSRRLRRENIENPERDAWHLWQHASGSGDADANPGVSPNPEVSYWRAITRRCQNVPLAHITGRRSFYDLEFLTSPDALIPRPDSEAVVRLACRIPAKTILDVGTGTGCLLLSILANSPGSHGTGTDICPRALAVARANGHRLNLADRCRFFISDWLKSDRLACYDLILSNPPYISEDDYRNLSLEVREHEPRHALTFGRNGTEAYERIASQAVEHLRPGGWLLFEIGYGQFSPVRTILQAHGLTIQMIERDLDDRIRVIAARSS